MVDPFADLPHGHYGAILADPPWQFKTLWGTPTERMELTNEMSKSYAVVSVVDLRDKLAPRERIA
jgi:hypothetical protein